MKKLQYSAGMKAVAILLQNLFSVMFVVSFLLISILLDRKLLNAGDLGVYTFTDSTYYEELFQSAAAEILQCREYGRLFGTQGVYDPDKPIDIIAYARQASGFPSQGKMETGTGVYYYLGDLEEWSRNYRVVTLQVEYSLHQTEEGGLYQLQQLLQDGEVIDSQQWQIETVKDMAKFQQEQILKFIQEQNIYGEEQPDTGDAYQIFQSVETGNFAEFGGQGLITFLEDIGMLATVNQITLEAPEEAYLTLSGSTLLEEYRSDNMPLTELKKRYDALNYTLRTIGEEITAYKRLLNKYEKEDSNIQFLIYNESQDYRYTNMSDESLSQMEEYGISEYGKMLGSYFYYNKNQVRLDTTVGGMEDVFFEKLEGKSKSGNNLIFIGVNTEFPFDDALRSARDEYNALRPWAIVSMVTAVIGLFGFFLSFIYLSLAAGRSSRDEEMHLNWFDRIKTEFFMVGFLVMFMVGVLLTSVIIRLFSGSDLIGLMILAGGLTLILTSSFMIFYLSFVRRVKAGMLWRGSLLYWIASGIQKVVKNWRTTLRILVVFALHSAVLILLGLLVVISDYSTLAIGLALIGFLALSTAELTTFLREGVQRNVIIGEIKRIAGGKLEYKIDTEALKGDNKIMGEALNAIGEGLYRAVGDSMKNERLKADLITNVSHDIKTPLTSIINYVDLLKREELDNVRVQSYIRVLDSKSQRLKQLTEDLVEASKISSGNIILQMDRLNFVELVHQTAGEFDERFQERGLTAITRLPKEPVMILADGRRIWRVIENLYHNVSKYAMENTRVYVDMELVGAVVALSIKNISQQALNIDASELTERFIRGDLSRSTEGSGLGLSIAQDLTTLMGGTFNLYLDGDLFKVTVTFPLAPKEAEG